MGESSGRAEDNYEETLISKITIKTNSYLSAQSSSKSENSSSANEIRRRLGVGSSTFGTQGNTLKGSCIKKCNARTVGSRSTGGQHDPSKETYVTAATRSENPLHHQRTGKEEEKNVPWFDSQVK